MTEHTVEGEMELFQTFKDSKVTLFPGTPMMCSEPGWFRIVVTADKEMLQEGKLGWNAMEHTFKNT